MICAHSIVVVRPSVLGLSRLLYQIAVTYHVIRKILLQPQEGLRAS